MNSHWLVIVIVSNISLFSIRAPKQTTQLYIVLHAQQGCAMHTLVTGLKQQSSVWGHLKLTLKNDQPGTNTKKIHLITGAAIFVCWVVRLSSLNSLDSQNPEIQRPKGGVPTCGAKKGRSSRLRWWKRDSRCTTPRYSATPAWKGRINCGLRSQESSVSQVVPPIFAQLPIHDLARQCMKNKTAIAGMKWSENSGNIWTFGQISLDAESLVLREGSGWGREWGRGAHANHRTNPRRDGNPSTTARGAQRHHLDVLQAHWTPDAHASAESAHTLWVRDGPADWKDVTPLATEWKNISPLMFVFVPFPFIYICTP